MRVSTKGRYSLIALLYLALLKKETYASTREIAEVSGISEGYLEQLFIPLRKAGIIQGVRGPAGGYYLEKDAREIKVGAILRAVEGSLSPAECVDSTQCPAAKSCASRLAWYNLHNTIQNFVDSLTLADILDDYSAHKDPEYAI